MRKIIILLIWTICTTSCLNDFLNVEPVSDIYSDKYWKTEMDAKGALTSIYASLQTAFSAQSGVCYMSWFEGRGDNFFGSNGGNYPMGEVNRNNFGVTHPGADWNRWYKAISTANYAIFYIPQMKEITNLKRDHLLAEAYFLRAYCYFMLYRIWGDVPLIVKPTLSFDDLEKPARTSKETVMNELILVDLRHAREKMDPASSEQFFCSAGAIYALSVEVAMWNKNYDDAITYSEALLGLKKGNTTEDRYSLVSTGEWPDLMAKATTAENIWTLKWSFVNNGYNVIASQMCSGTYISVAKTVRDIWFDQVWEDDIRRANTIDESALYPATHLGNSTQSMSMWKWGGANKRPTQQNELYIPLFRLGDIILLRAEALNQRERYGEALAELNKIRARAGLTSRQESDYANAADKKKAIEDDILLERRFELFGEGKRWFDLVRTGRAMETMNDFFENYIEANNGGACTRIEEEWQLYWPITPNNILDNGNLVQTGNY